MSVRPAFAGNNQRYCKPCLGERLSPLFLSSMTSRMIAGFLLACIVSIVARRQQALSSPGAIAAIAIATICTMAGWTWAFMLLAFFLAGTFLSRVGNDTKRTANAAFVEKSGARDAHQVIANGGPFAIVAVASIFWPHLAWQLAGAGAIAASSADTWATEIGGLSRSQPRLITSFVPVTAGTSGGVTWLGIAASLGGAALIALVTFLMGWPGRAACACLIGGVGGSLVDSLLGATVQSRRRCPQCRYETEKEAHSCGTTTEFVGGVPWIDNDVVNCISSICGATLGALCIL